MDIRELMKPCPFCGRKVETSSLEFDGIGIRKLEVDCSCGASIQIESGDVISSWNGDRKRIDKDALEKWNTRERSSE